MKWGMQCMTLRQEMPLYMNYEKIGFKAGLEVHQQLNTKTKLFCKCKTERSQDLPLTFTRKFQAVASELGEIDVAAKHEQEKALISVYKYNPDTSCLVEMDSEPPHNLNPEALEIALQIAKAFNAKPVEQIQVMRKVVIDGSAVSGFQRTALVAVDGNIDGVSIPSICLEEDAATPIKREQGKVFYRIDRLGIPLIELTTGPDIKNPEQVQEIARKIGLILRSTGRVKRGIGTIRQDVNISVTKGNRVEIKGAQDLKSFPLLAEKEVKRQQKLISASKKVPKEVRRALPDNTTNFLRPMPGAARLYPETDILPITVTKEQWDKIKIPESPEKAKARLVKTGLSQQLVERIYKSKNKDWFEVVYKKHKSDAMFIGTTLTNTIVKLRREGVDVAKTRFVEVLNAYFSKKIPKQAVEDALRTGNIGKGLMSEKQVEKIVKQVVKQNKKLLSGHKPFPKLMGIVMKETHGTADGKLVAKLVKKYVR